jgi:hypothetical protein
MSNEIHEHLMLSFLEKNFPVYRIKHNNKFKRAIILDFGERFILSDDSHQIQLRYKLNGILIKVFNCNEKTSTTVLKTFLNLK